MLTFTDPEVNQWLLSGTVMFFLVWSAVAAAIGAGLLFSSRQTFRLFGVLNQYVSTRHGMKPLAMSHDFGRTVHKHRYIWGTLFAAGAAYSLYNLGTVFDARILAVALDLPYPAGFVSWLLESTRWGLIIFGGFAFVVGIMLIVFPNTLARFETGGDHWISLRKLALGGDSLHLPLDRVVAAFPRTAGIALLAGALVVLANAAIVWSGIR